MGSRMKRALELLGCRVLHTQKRDASAKGKAERIMPFFTEKLDSELMAQKDTFTIDQANKYMEAILSMDYHDHKHSSIGEKPSERYFNFPGRYRRFVSGDALSKVFLPFTKAYVSKTGLIRRDKKDYLVPDASLYGSYVEVRYDPLDTSKVHVWHKDKYIGEAFFYTTGNNFIKRDILAQEIKPEIKVEIPLPDEVPVYNYLEHRLEAYRQEISAIQGLSKELEGLTKKKGEIRAELLKSDGAALTSGQVNNSKEEENITFDAGRLVLLMALLLRRKLTANERLAVHLCWQKYGPFGEKAVRHVVGHLLGEGHPISDLTGYMDAIRVDALNKNVRGEK